MSDTKMTPQLPDIELIKSMHQFPGAFTFKVIGDSRQDFVADALNQVMSAVAGERAMNHSTRNSAAGNHVAVTVSVKVETAEEVHAIYRNLLSVSGLRALF
jgi:putative lipoic acid-binding regulatory protein